MPLLGAHMSIAGGLYRALLRGKEAGCRAIQIFARNRSQWHAGKLTTNDIDLFHKTREETSIDPVAVHNSYLINLASPRSDIFEKSFHVLLDELERAELLGIPYLVMHPGSHLREGEKKGLRRFAEAIDRVHDRTPDYRVKILLETTAGQGTNLGYRFEHLAEILESTGSHERLGVCFDTCHVFAAGYDFRTAETYSQLLTEFDATIGLSRLRLFHINDSKNELGSRIDRHEHPGEGRIGSKAFSFILNEPKFAGHSFLLETPKGKDENGLDRDVVNLNLLKSLINEADNNDCV
jgi:deoxyribonuclease-4